MSFLACDSLIPSVPAETMKENEDVVGVAFSAMSMSSRASNEESGVGW
ncbi:unnamed protein product [Amoebophrya sp. A120]|nr:unnamed protein product [Amoebophrya sp. A120]|eukprot:GSA120T00000250001.1